MPKTLLLADDSVTIQKVVGISFANEDVVLLTVDNGDDALLRAREARPDLVLADILMPGKDGYEVCEAIKGDPALRHVPVLLLSGTFESFDEERARRVGADGHITKPFEAQALVDRVNELLARSAAVAPARDISGDATLLVSEPVAGDGDAFDFFDEEMAQTAPAPQAAPTVLVGDDQAFGSEGDGLELEAAVEEDIAEVAALPVAADPFAREPDAAADTQATVAIFPDDDAFAAPPGGAHARGDEAFDFGFEAAQSTAASAHEPAAPPQDGSAAHAFEPIDAGSDLLDEAFGAPLDGDPRASVPPAVPAMPAPPPIPSLPAELPAGLQRQLHESLEKIAWEAFGDLSERIVREALARVEAVAWEVIPQMAEVLIREEIRRLKDSE